MSDDAVNVAELCSGYVQSMAFSAIDVILAGVLSVSGGCPVHFPHRCKSELWTDIQHIRAMSSSEIDKDQKSKCMGESGNLDPICVGNWQLCVNSTIIDDLR